MDTKATPIKTLIFSLGKYVLTFILVFILSTFLLICVAKIPKSYLYENMLESAQYLSDAGMGNYLFGTIKATCTDQFADSLLLNIAYNYDQNNSLESIIWSKYSGAPDPTAGTHFLESVKYGKEPNQEYLRYWHGSNVFLRPLHLIFNLKQIYLLHAFIIAAMLVYLVWLLVKNSYKPEAVSILISMVAVSIWTVPFCLEYTWVFLIMLSVAIVAVKLVLSGNDKTLGIIFLITGMATAYLDFLTAETLTFLIPILLIIRIKYCPNDKIYSYWLSTLKYGVAWILGYICMWSSKWALSSLVLHQDVMQYVTGSITLRQGGSLIGLKKGYLINMYLSNIGRLFPFDYGIIGGVVFFIFLIIIFILVYKNAIHLKESIDGRIIGLYAAIFAIPFLRFLVMHSHSRGHYIFTYRALAGSVLAFCFIILEIVEFVPKKKGSMK